MLAVYLYQLEVIEKNIFSISMKLQWYSLIVQYISFYPVTPYICTVLQFERWCHFGKIILLPKICMLTVGCLCSEAVAREWRRYQPERLHWQYTIAPGSVRVI